MRGLATIFSLVLLLVFAPAAMAQTPLIPVPQPPPPAPPPVPPKAGKVKISVSGGQGTRKLRYVARGAAVRVSGRVKPFVAGQTAVLEVLRKGKVVSRQRAKVRKGGKVSFRFKTRRRGVLRLLVRHAATPQQVAFKSRSARVKAVVLRAGEGSRGTKVVLLQRGLRRLGFAVPVNGAYEAGTARAVIAFRKTNNMARNGFADARVFSLVLQGRGAFKLRHPKAGTHVEFDWSRQVLVLARKGRPWRTYHSSSGTPATPTVFGRFRFYRKDFGTNAKGMVHSSYFIRGYAIHGYSSVPNYPASHGCLRVPIPNALQIFNAVSHGESIFVYR
jgi:lipoprotein-anchoring transpeptidase ErfK/SrfK